MGQDVPNVDFFPVKVNSSNEPVFIATDIEDHIPINIISARKMLFEFIESIIIGVSHNLIPSFQ